MEQVLDWYVKNKLQPQEQIGYGRDRSFLRFKKKLKKKERN